MSKKSVAISGLPQTLSCDRIERIQYYKSFLKSLIQKWGKSKGKLLRNPYAHTECALNA